IEAFIRKKERWVRERLAGPRRIPFVWEAGAKLPWLGRVVTLALRHGEIGVWLSQRELEFGLADGASLRERALDWMRRQALAFFRERVAALSQAPGLSASKVGLSDARTRCGCCGARITRRASLPWPSPATARRRIPRCSSSPTIGAWKNTSSATPTATSPSQWMMPTRRARK